MADEAKDKDKDKKEESKKDSKPVKKNAAALMTKDEPKKPAAKKSEKSAGKSNKKSDADTKKKAHKFHHTAIEHHSDGSHTVRHVPDGGGDEVSYAAPDLNAVTSGLQQNLGGGQEEPPAPVSTAGQGAPSVVPE